MMKVSRGAWLAMAAVVAVPVTVAFAKSGDHRGWHNMSPETRTRLDEGKIAMAKTALKLTADQEKLWQPLEEQARAFMKVRQDKMAERKKSREDRKAEKKADGAEAKRPDMAERLAKMSTDMTERADRMKAFSGAFSPFYASLSEEQKEVLRPLMRDLSPGMGGRGHKGPRWAHGGGWGYGGKGGDHGGWGGRHDRGGPVIDDAGPGDDIGGDAAKPVEPEPKN
ncbi:MAG TPA: Spy/CpxP family protein refolding chaperone [Hyphomicrobium sp.]|nr:Spy/CpxP family protein refolding chaperone [Hyphomicrobium sp.]